MKAAGDILNWTVRIAVILMAVFISIKIDAHNLIPSPRIIHFENDRTCEMKRIDARVDNSLDLPPEGYVMKIKRGKVVIRSKDDRGLIWANSTLEQLKSPDGQIPDVYIEDYPAFPIRGFMHDTGRNFRPVEMIKEELELFSFYKLNVFHWHLTDYPAWRIECKVYPQLNDPDFQQKGRDEGRFYTYDEIRDVIDFASRLGITVIPEIDMPGHSSYFTDTFGFPMNSPEGMAVLEKCLEEFFSEIPAADCPYMHIGSDEVYIDNPRQFMDFCENIVRKNGRIPIVWCPGLPASDSTVHQVWRASAGAEIEKDGAVFPYIDSYQGYLNIGHPVLNVSRYFLHQPCGLEKTDSLALGGILCLWNDIKLADKSLLFPHNGMPGGMLAFAECFWCGGDRMPIEDDGLIPDKGSKEYEDLVEFEGRMSSHRDRFLYEWNMRWVANAGQHWKVTLPELPGTSPDSMVWKDAWGGVIDMNAFCRKNNVKTVPEMDAWMTAEIYSASDTVITAWVGFEAPGRATRMSDGIGRQGHWEASGRLFVNDEELFPPVPWTEPGKYRFHEHTWHTQASEIPYTNEQLCWMRTPASVPLKKGRNTVRLYCPRVFNNDYWYVTFIPVTVDKNGHVSEAEGIYFH